MKERFTLSWNAAREAIRSGKVFVGDPGSPVTDPTVNVAASEALALRMNAPRPHVAHRAALEREAILHLDNWVVVVNKPSGVSTVPFGDETPEQAKNTLDALVRDIIARKMAGSGDGGRGRAPLGVVHRLDKDTSGVLVFTRTLDAKRSLANQFRAHSVERRYLAIVHGVLAGERTIESYIVDDRGDGLRGSVRHGLRAGQRAVTHVRALESLRGATLVACELETGRTHQIRIHLSEAGHPVVGESVYIRDYRGERIEAPRTMLHAAELGFEHPATGEDVHFAAGPPADFLAVVRRLSAT